jgi:hypothetical protein
MKFLILFILLIGFLIGPEEVKNPERHLFVIPSFEADTLSRYSVRIDFNDTIPGDTLRVYTNGKGLIHSYSREINTGVCIDGECRRLSMELYWTVTGRYYGFVLPEGEFLSKTEHVPFKDEDYKKLEEILGNPYSVLGNYAIDELITDGRTEVDGITAATLAAVKQESVPDAVYTSYTLWHLVYGETQKKIRQYTRDHLTDELALLLLKSQDFGDKLWTIENMGQKLYWNNELRQVVLDLIVNEKGILAVQALAVFPDTLLEEPEAQLALTRQFAGMAYGTQRKVLERLSRLSHLDTGAVQTLATVLGDLNSGVIDGVLKLFRTHQIEDEDVDQKVALLLDHDNLFLARRAADYFTDKKTNDKKILRRISKIRKGR